MNNSKYLLVVNHIVSSVFRAVDVLAQDQEFKNLRVVLITQNPQTAERYKQFIDKDHVIICDFSQPDQIEQGLKPFKDNIVGVVCRGDKHIQYLRKVIPYLPADVLVSSPQALKIATNKSLMRQAFLDKYPQITPKFLKVSDASPKTLDEVDQTVGFPVIIKPANLFSSLLIQTCNDKNALKSALDLTFSQIAEIYSREGIGESPQVIVEEFLDGNLYSTDAFILDGDKVYCSPLVGYVPAQQLGIDDFFLYKRFIPSGLDDDEVNQAFDVTQKAMNAVGLKYSAAHVELIKTKNGWKVIELGPRLGRFRSVMYRLGYGIDLSLADVRVHLGLTPSIPDKLINFCSAYSIYPRKEGTLKSIKGLEELEATGLINSIKVFGQPGDKCYFAKNGGHALAEFIISTPDKTKYQQTIEFIEKNVYADID